jgi:hypothetical protein
VNDTTYWQQRLAEAELDAARKRSEVDAAAAKLQRARAALKRLEQEAAERPSAARVQSPKAGSGSV